MINKSIHTMSINMMGQLDFIPASYLMMKFSSQSANKFSEKLTNLNLNAKQAGVLMAVFFLKDISQKELGGKLNIDRSSITKMIDDLEKLELVERIQDQANRRANKISLTDKGKKLTNDIFKVLKELDEEIFSAVTKEEKDKFKEILMKLDRGH